MPLRFMRSDDESRARMAALRRWRGQDLERADNARAEGTGKAEPRPAPSLARDQAARRARLTSAEA